jgi:glycyl-tRNA synthetase beta chain
MKTAEFLLEFFTEEIPARMQASAQASLRELLTQQLTTQNLQYASVTTYATPRRLTAVVAGLSVQQPNREEERKGPSVTANTQAIEGFLKSTGLTLDQCEKRVIDGKGEFFFAVMKSKGRPTVEVLPEIIQHVIAHLPWDKSMTWGTYKMRWVRPLRQVLALFDGQVIPLALEDPAIVVSDTTRGHRFMGNQSFKVNDFKDYQSKLYEAYVILDPAARSAKIMEDAKAMLAHKKLHLKEDVRLLAEVTGLVEWPVVLMGKIEDKFMTLPPEVLMTSMKNHQKYFSVLDAKGAMAPHFITISNQESIDAGKQIVAGNEKVLRARLADALFFWQQDTKIALTEWKEKLKSQIFHEQLGTVFDKTQRVKKLLPKVVALIDPKLAQHTDRLADIYKADLPTGMVGEFPELQGIMGGYYAAHHKEPAEVCQAIREHYQPLGPDAPVPSAPLSVALALADKLDTLAGFFSVGIMPTGSKDPYALRRAALGVIRLMLENNLSLDLSALIEGALELHTGPKETSKYLLDFIKERFNVYLKGQGIDHNIVQAIQGQDNLDNMYRLAQSLSTYRGAQDGQATIAAIQRALSILDASQSKLKDDSNTQVKINLLKIPAEKELYESVEKVRVDLEPMLSKSASDYSKILKALHALTNPINHFFDNVIVNDEDMDLRGNRYALLANIEALITRIGDFRVL